MSVHFNTKTAIDDALTGSEASMCRAHVLRAPLTPHSAERSALFTRPTALERPVFRVHRLCPFLHGNPSITNTSSLALAHHAFKKASSGQRELLLLLGVEIFEPADLGLDAIRIDMIGAWKDRPEDAALDCGLVELVGRFFRS